MNKFGFPNDPKYRFRIEKRLYRVNPDGAEALSILSEIHTASLTAKDRYWALRLRQHIRRIEFLNCRAIMSHVIKMTRDDRMRLLAIWLRGRCGGYIGTSSVAEYASSTCFEIQKESVRALQRMSGWADLRQIADSAENLRIRNLAKQRTAKPLNDRINSLLRNMRPIPQGSKNKELWLLPGLALGFTTPKTIETIRRILLRIKHLVSNPNG